MKKLYKLVVSIVCMMMMFFNTFNVIEAAELQDIFSANITIDPRPDYSIFVNRALNCISVVQQEPDGTVTPVKAMVCSCGKEGHETPEGVFQTSDYYEWRLMVDRSYGRYAVRFNGKILFHSVPYTKTSPDSLEWEEYNALGENASLGCVRLSVEDAKWIYDNCKPGTTVVVYSDGETAGLLEKPAAIKIAEDSPCRGWDPTDLDINNPWFAAVTESVTVPNVGAVGTVPVSSVGAVGAAPVASVGAVGTAPVALAETVGVSGVPSAFIVETREAVSVPRVGTVDEFNYVEYANTYSDLMVAFGYDKNLLYTHYILYGMKEGRVATFNYTT